MPRQNPQALLQNLQDAGCGEGYYSAGLFQTLAQAGKSPRLAGVDLSKHALRRAAKRVPDGEFAVASVYHLPVADGVADLLVDCFSPLALTEFWRVLKPGGWFLYVVPGARHLWELKQVLYDRPYPNEEKQTPYPGFAYRAIREVDFTAHLPDPQTIQDLFQMTPYFWKTPKEGAARLAALPSLDTTVSFRVHVFQKAGQEGARHEPLPLSVHCGRLHRPALRRQPRRRLPPAPAGGPDAKGGPGEQPLRDRFPDENRRRLCPAVVHPRRGD